MNTKTTHNEYYLAQLFLDPSNTASNINVIEYLIDALLHDLPHCEDRIADLADLLTGRQRDLTHAVFIFDRKYKIVAFVAFSHTYRGVIVEQVCGSGQGTGTLAMLMAMNFALGLRDSGSILLSSTSGAAPFYNKLGFERVNNREYSHMLPYEGIVDILIKRLDHGILKAWKWMMTKGNVNLNVALNRRRIARLAAIGINLNGRRIGVGTALKKKDRRIKITRRGVIDTTAPKITRGRGRIGKRRQLR